MECPVDGCPNPVEPGPNCRIKVENEDRTVEKIVCQDCADMYMGHLIS